MEAKKEYWINIASKKKTPVRNYIHVRIEGTARTLCGQGLNPEFDVSDGDKWEKILNGNGLVRKRMCKNCKLAVRNLRDIRDVQVTNSLKTVSGGSEQDIEDEIDPDRLTQHDNDEGEIELAYEHLISNANELSEKCDQTIRLLYRDWRSDSTNSLNTFLKMNAVKKLEQACLELKNN